MGCGDSKKSPSGDKLANFEFDLAFRTVDILSFERCVKHMVIENEGVSIRQLEYSFKGLEQFDFAPEKPLGLIVDKMVDAEEQEDGFISVNALMMLALLHCHGDVNKKSMMLYGILSEDLNSHIAWNDKDVRPTFEHMAELATVFMADVHSAVREEPNPFGGDKMQERMRQKIVAFADQVIKEIWGPRPDIEQHEFLRIICQHHSYFFSSEALRRRVEKQSIPKLED